jgi:hypothetical protein
LQELKKPDANKVKQQNYVTSVFEKPVKKTADKIKEPKKPESKPTTSSATNGKVETPKSAKKKKKLN